MQSLEQTAMLTISGERENHCLLTICPAQLQSCSLYNDSLPI